MQKKQAFMRYSTHNLKGEEQNECEDGGEEGGWSSNGKKTKADPFKLFHPNQRGLAEDAKEKTFIRYSTQIPKGEEQNE
ncbi:hypothetical protein CEXT_225431 [Caerostris extrusa]|uniref:Uncharacterized protein n=1 Tax=Caerostris extrusa TaxID=172846 RepID=A0AAV4PPD8_CAEEX|nr:hypothetical protein CEXT_225431 [Caerostris extrusa]